MLYNILYQSTFISIICGILGFIIISLHLYYYGWKNKHITSFLIGAILLTILVIDAFSFFPIMISNNIFVLITVMLLTFILLCLFEILMLAFGEIYHFAYLRSFKSIFFIILPIIQIICSITYSLLFYNDYVVQKEVLNENVIIGEVETKELCMFNNILLSNKANIKYVKLLNEDTSENESAEDYLSFWYIDNENNVIPCNIPNENITFTPSKNDKSYVEITNYVKLSKKGNKAEALTKEITQAPTKYVFYIQDGIIFHKE